MALGLCLLLTLRKVMPAVTWSGAKLTGVALKKQKIQNYKSEVRRFIYLFIFTLKKMPWFIA